MSATSKPYGVQRNGVNGSRHLTDDIPDDAWPGDTWENSLGDRWQMGTDGNWKHVGTKDQKAA